MQELERDKASLEERVTQLVVEGVAHEVIRSELEESRIELCRLQQAVELHEAAARQVPSDNLFLADQGLIVVVNGYFLVETQDHKHRTCVIQG